MKKNILITGGSGFIGTNLIECLKADYTIITTYNSNSNFKKIEGVKYLKLDLEDKKNCKNLCKNIDVVIMCAANSSGAKIMESNPLVHLSPNLRMNINLLEEAYQHKVDHFIFISSNTVYPEVDFPVKETDASYSFFHKYYIVGWMKRFSEVLCDIYSNKIKKPMKTTVIRPGNLYGPHDKFDEEKSKVIPSLIRKVVKRENPIVVWGDGEDLKDFLYIEDFCNAVKAILKKKLFLDIVNIASGSGITIKEILKNIIKIENAEELEIKFDKTKPTMIPKRLINIEFLKKEINFKQNFNIFDGLNKTIKWYRSQFDNF